MNPSLRTLLPLLGLAMAQPGFAADSSPALAAPKPDPKARREMRVITSTDGGPGQHRVLRREPGEMESVTFLGVEAGPVSATLAAQLGLAEGNGLVVNQVLPESPATGALKQHDILLKLDDQILIEQRQLAVLVRGHKEGDEVTLTYLRGGKQATVKVKLAKHDVPKMTMLFAPRMPEGGNVLFGHRMTAGPGAGGGSFDVQVMPSDVLGDREEVNRVLSLIDGAAAPGQRRIEYARTIGPGDRNVSVTVNTGNSRILSDDDKGSLELIIKEGKKELVAKNKQGAQVFAGPVNTPEERKALPEEVRERLNQLEDMKQFSFRTDGDFQGAETKILRPRGQGISLPAVPPRSPARESLSF